MTVYLRRMLALILTLMLTPVSAAFAYSTEMVTDVDFQDFGQQAYQYLVYIDQNLWCRRSTDDTETEAIQDWILSELAADGYESRQIRMQDFIFKGPYDEDFLSQNIIVTLPGKSASQIIVGAHYDGRGIGDNGSGIAVLMEALKRLHASEPLDHTIVFVFFGAEESGMEGSDAYVDSMTDDDVANTAFMVNVDAVLCGDFCYLYGGVPDFNTKTVVELDAFHKAYALSQQLGLGLHLVPWTFEHPAPGYDVPEYPSPSTGNWSNHYSFINRGIQYIYFEASNWDIPGSDNLYDGHIETAEVGGFMHRDVDNLNNIEALFPGRALYHMQVFSMLLDAVLREQ